MDTLTVDSSTMILKDLISVEVRARMMRSGKNRTKCAGQNSDGN